jgi:hypothetical protein
MLDIRFAELIQPFPESMERLLAMPPVTIATLPRQMPASGIYLWTENEHHIYVGRSRRMKQRLQEHARPSSGHNQASFAFLLARDATGMTEPSYSPTGSRDQLLQDASFKTAFDDAKKRLRQMHIRFVEELDPVRQCLLEVYAATVLMTRYNSFESH